MLIDIFSGMRTRRAFLLLAAVFSTIFVAPATAADIAFGTLTFTTPTGIVGPTDDLPVYLTFTLDPASPALSFAGDRFTSGFYTESEVAELGFDITKPYQQSIYSIMYCGGASLNCPAAIYTYETASGPGTFNDLTDLTIAPGGSYTGLVGTFHPIGSAPDGTYTLTALSINAIVYGTRPNGQPGYYRNGLAATCPDGDPICGFSRTVATTPDAPAVPEPTTWVMLLAGFALAGLALRRPHAIDALALA